MFASIDGRASRASRPPGSLWPWVLSARRRARGGRLAAASRGAGRAWSDGPRQARAGIPPPAWPLPARLQPARRLDGGDAIANFEFETQIRLERPQLLRSG